MGIIEDINRSYQEGKSEQDISISLQQQGYSMKDISDAMSQAKIKQAVSQSDQSMGGYSQDKDMQQSVMSSSLSEKMNNEPKEYQQPSSQTPQNNQPPVPQEQPGQAQYPQGYPPQQYAQNDYGYQQYDQYSQYPQTGSDAISEIAEQVIIEKLSPLKNKLDSVLDMRTTFESKISSIDERLKRLEKIIDRLQLSILQKVGEYVTNVEDIKKEMQETQKSFKTLLNQKPDYKQL